MKFTKLQNGVLRSADELGINYIENGDAELSSPAPSLYADSGATPTDGQGGSVNTSTELNFSRSTSSPLRGSASWVFDKKSGNQQGKGGAFPFTIDSADQAKVMQIGFDYAVASGTYATGDVAIYVVDVTNGTVIQPSAYQVENVGVNSTARLTFQTASNSTSYRLCFHVASTSASAYSLKFDNITLGPQVVPMGAPVTDRTRYTPGVNNTTGMAERNGTWKQVGDEMVMSGSIRFTGTGGAISSEISLPSGYSIDLTKLNDTSSLASLQNGIGFWGWYDDAGSQAIDDQFVRVLSATSVQLVRASNTVSWNTFANGDRIFWEVRVPIVGWSSSTVVSSSADTRVVAWAGKHATAGSIGTSLTPISYANESIDTHNAYNTSTGIFTAPVPGAYKVSGTLHFAGASWTIGVVYDYRILIDGSSQVISQSQVARTATQELPALTVEHTFQLNAGQTIQFAAFQNESGAGRSLGGAAYNFASINLIQGPSQIAREEIITMLCYKNTGSHTNSGGLQDVASWNAVTKDSHGGFNTTTGVYTCPAPGDYMVTFTLGFGSTSGARQGVVLKGSTIVAYGPLVPNGDPSINPPITIMVPNCVAGDTIKAQAFQNSGGNLVYTTTANQMYLQVHRIG